MSPETSALPVSRGQLISTCSIATLLTVVCGLTAFTSSATAAQMSFGNFLPGGAMVNKNVVSLRESRYTNLVEQKTDFSCGAAAVATILNYAYGKRVTEHDVIRGMLEVSDAELVKEQGFSLLDIKRYAEGKLGMRARGYEVTPATLEKVQIPVIVLLDIRGYKHFVVLKKTQGDRVYLGDPALGNRVMNRDDFVSGWNGIVFALIGPGFVSDTVLINPPEPLTARGLRGVHGTRLTNAQLLEFGFVHADLF